MGMIKIVIGDIFITSMWVFCMPLVRILTGKIVASIGIQTLSLAARFIATVFTTVLVIIVSALGKIFGGSSFNPAASMTFHADGKIVASIGVQTLSLLRYEIIPSAPNRSESAIDWLPDFAGYSWVAYASESAMLFLKLCNYAYRRSIN